MRLYSLSQKSAERAKKGVNVIRSHSQKPCEQQISPKDISRQLLFPTKWVAMSRASIPHLPSIASVSFFANCWWYLPQGKKARMVDSNSKLPCMAATCKAVRPALPVVSNISLSFSYLRMVINIWQSLPSIALYQLEPQSASEKTTPPVRCPKSGSNLSNIVADFPLLQKLCENSSLTLWSWLHYSQTLEYTSRSKHVHNKKHLKRKMKIYRILELENWLQISLD